VRLIRLADCAVTTWRNGGGHTRVVATGPPEAEPDQFGWRLSVAQVDRSGPFSAYPGVERHLILAEGDSLTLVVDGRPRVLRPSELTAFDGGAQVSGEVAGSPVMAVNLMTRRDQVSAQVAVEDGAAGVLVGSAETEVLVVALSRQTTLGQGGDALSALDTLWLGAGEHVPVCGGTVVVITLAPQKV
jgi:environmental stress-induced protein Ves